MGGRELVGQLQQQPTQACLTASASEAAKAAWPSAKATCGCKCSSARYAVRSEPRSGIYPPALKSMRMRSTGKALGGRPDSRYSSVPPRPYRSEAGEAAPRNCTAIVRQAAERLQAEHRWGCKSAAGGSKPSPKLDRQCAAMHVAWHASTHVNMKWFKPAQAPCSHMCPQSCCPAGQPQLQQRPAGREGPQTRFAIGRAGSALRAGQQATLHCCVLFDLAQSSVVCSSQTAQHKPHLHAAKVHQEDPAARAPALQHNVVRLHIAAVQEAWRAWGVDMGAASAVWHARPSKATQHQQ